MEHVFCIIMFVGLAMLWLSPIKNQNSFFILIFLSVFFFMISLAKSQILMCNVFAAYFLLSILGLEMWDKK